MAIYSPTELFRLKIYISLIGCVLLTFPLWFKGFYNFSRSGLTDEERKGTIAIFLSVSVLFLGIFTLIPLLGIIGLAITFVIGCIVQVGTHTVINKKFPYIVKK